MARDAAARAVEREVDERERVRDPFDVMLDQWEASTRLLVEHGLDVQLRARFERLVTPRVAEPDKKPDIEPAFDPLKLATVVTTCRVLERFKLTADQHAAITDLKRWALDQLRGPQAATAATAARSPCSGLSAAKSEVKR